MILEFCAGNSNQALFEDRIQHDVLFTQQVVYAQQIPQSHIISIRVSALKTSQWLFSVYFLFNQPPLIFESPHPLSY